MPEPLKRIKPYKAKPPEETISGIKTAMAKAGLHFEENMVSGNPFFKAISLNLINPVTKQAIFSTYGKGSSLQWATASAWGEMAERIQNLAFYMACIFPALPETDLARNRGFNYYPDEKFFSLADDPGMEFMRFFEQLTGIETTKNEHFRNIVGVPFHDIFENKIQYLPFRALQVIAGSNGMCSGNTREEALVQGISEIFERYVLKSIYLDPFCPPDIPLIYFEGTEIGLKIKELARMCKYEVRIKDCSMGKGYPVIGALITDRTNRYSFHLGANPSPITALERCFNEMHQGGNIRFQSIDELKENSSYNLDDDYWRKQMSLTIKSYKGQWPPQVLSSLPSYEFTGFYRTESVSDQNDLEYLLQILKKEERKVYIRDNTFLGQPAFYIYVQGMSEMTSLPDSSFSTVYLELDKHLPFLFNLNKTTLLDREEIKRVLEKYISASPWKDFFAADYFKFNPSHPIASLSSDQLLALLDFSLCDGKIEDHFSKDEINSNSFLKKINEMDPCFRPSEIFNFMKIPACFECAACDIRNNCNLPYLVEIWHKMKEIMTEKWKKTR